jgi:hypothetical protein
MKTHLTTPHLPRLVRLPASRENLIVMVDLLCAIIEMQVLPSINSPLHHTARWLVDDAGLKPKRRRTRLRHRKPNVSRLVRRCPKCNCGRWRYVGEIARVGISNGGKASREVDMKIVECMKCDYSWDILTEDSESAVRR